eukprot:414374-Amphidinium_carterae.1
MLAPQVPASRTCSPLLGEHTRTPRAAWVRKGDGPLQPWPDQIPAGTLCASSQCPPVVRVRLPGR